MSKRVYAALLAILIMAGTGFAQNKGSVTGKITDKQTNEELIGANILVSGTAIGASTDIDGVYSIRNLEPGNYELKVSYISYQTLIIKDVKIEAGKEAQLNISMVTSATQLEEVVVTAEAMRNSEAAVLKIQKNSINIVDGISAELIKKNNSSDGTDILKTMTGVTISDGKYAYIRGIGDRYNNTLLNGANLPSTDPEKKSFSYDIFPASLIENVVTAKTFTPDKPADFSGGLVQIQTLEFPQAFFWDFSYSAGYNESNNLASFMGYQSGSQDWLGQDDGTRALPSLVPGFKLTPGNFNGVNSDSALKVIGLGFKNNWDLKDKKSMVNGSYKLSIGDKYEFDGNTLGLVGSLSYASSFDIKSLEKRAYTYEGLRYEYGGSTYNYSVVWGALANISFKTANKDKISFKNIYNQSGDDEVTQYKGDYLIYGQYRETNNLKFVSRILRSHQLIGEHRFNLLNGINLEWNTSFAKSFRDEPDNRRYIYSKNNDDPEEPLRFQLDQSLASRFFSDLDDENTGANFSVTMKPFAERNMPTLKFGLGYDDKNRSFNARSFGFKNIPGGSFFREDTVLQRSVEEIFQPENFENRFIQIVEITKPSDSYSSEQSVFASYLMFDWEVIDKVRMIFGARLENSQQRLLSKSQTDQPVSIDNANSDILPAVSITYLFNDITNFRFAFSKTLARPEFRELAPFSYFDFLANELVIGNESLRRTTVTNYDFRYELFMGPGELLALSLYYKSFVDPIEQILTASSALEPIRSYKNADKAENYGFEMELRKSMGFISDYISNLSLVGNLSLISSKITLGSSGIEGFQTSERPLQGQANYILNVGFYYDDFQNGINSSLTYNKVGDRINKVGTTDIGDIIQKSRDQIDFSFSKKIFKNLAVKAAAKDLLAQDYNFVQKTPFGEKVVEEYKTNISFSLGMSFAF
ncbi:MAG: carboxypeptidase-like regulatory domain-containing protein [Ignavibacteriaceae bacterium]|nr:carboxypeptidase-like regulatory domain-containing protein [Ignavibacteriaceae bacterium]